MGWRLCEEKEQQHIGRGPLEPNFECCTVRVAPSLLGGTVDIPRPVENEVTKGITPFQEGSIRIGGATLRFTSPRKREST